MIGQQGLLLLRVRVGSLRPQSRQGAQWPADCQQAPEGDEGATAQANRSRQQGTLQPRWVLLGDV